MYRPIHLARGLSYFRQSITQKINGPTRYAGNAKQICAQIVDTCWNGTYFQTSTHHYQEFWSRDFGYCAEHLLKLGYQQEVQKTLRYALKHYKKTGITTTITNNTPWSFPQVTSPDSIALFFHALRASRTDLASSERFLQKEAARFADTVLENGRVKRHTHFSSMRDYAKRDSSCYDHCMSILMAREARKLNLDFPYTEKELTKTLNEYWTGTHYRDDRSTNAASGDANTLPYWLGAGKHFSKALATIQRKKYDQPLPLKYGNKTEVLGAEFLVPGWQRDIIWPFLGFPWIHAVKQHKPALAKTYRKQYANIIEQHGTLYEIYDKKKPYKSLFYHADEGMLWAAIYLTL